MEEKVRYQTELSKKQEQGNLLIPVVGGSAIFSQVYNEDCVTGMKRYADKYFDLAVVDPPYGIGFDGEVETMVTNNASGKWKGARGKGYKRKDWDKNKPGAEYWMELWRVSKNQIVWGGNYFELPVSGGWIVWDKYRPDDFSLSQAELAWVRNSGRVAIFRYLWHGFQKQKPEERFHPTQKPIALYEWIFRNYASEGNLILDTHLGSGSSRIAAYKAGLSFVGYEADDEYYEAQERRFKIFVSQGRLW